MLDIIDIIWPTYDDDLGKGAEEWVILDKSLELSFFLLSVMCTWLMVMSRGISGALRGA